MRRKVFAVLCVLAVGVLLTGCMGITIQEFERNIKGKVQATNGGLRNISRFVDRHLFNYTWDDPYAFEDIYAGR